MSHDFVKIARVLKSNGTEGEVVLGFRDIDFDEIDLRNPVFIYFDGLPVPFFIESSSQRGNTKILAHLTDIDNFDDAEEIVGKDIYARRDDLPEADIDDDFSALVGWTLYLATDEEIGTITDFLDIPGNPCIEVSSAGSTVTIPLHEDLIISLDPDSKEIVMTVPEGLL